MPILHRKSNYMATWKNYVKYSASWNEYTTLNRQAYLNPMVSTATDICRGWSGHVYRLRSSIGSRSISWNIKQSQSESFNASTKPTFIKAARLNKPSATCSIRNIPYSICCFIRNGWRLARKIGKCDARSRYGITMATRSRAVHSEGLNQPPGRSWAAYRASIFFNVSSVVFTSIGPSEGYRKLGDWDVRILAA